MKANQATTIASKVKQAEMVAQENQNKPKAAKKNTKISTSCLYDIKADWKNKKYIFFCLAFSCLIFVASPRYDSTKTKANK